MMPTIRGFLKFVPGLAHRYATFLLKYSIGWRPKKEFNWEKIRLRKDSIEKRSNWGKIQLRIASIETSLDWEKTRMGNAEIEWHEDWNQTEHIMMKVILVKMGKSRWSKQWINYKKRGSRGSEQLIIDEWAVCREIWSIVPLKKDIYSMAHL